MACPLLRCCVWRPRSNPAPNIPIGHAIVEHARRERLVIGGAEGFQAMPGRGAEGLVDAEPVVVGNHRLFEERGLCSPGAHA